MKVHIISIPDASFSRLYLPAHHIPVYFRDLDAFMSDLPSQNTIYIQLSTLRDTLDITIISSPVNKIIIMECTNVLLWFLKASQERMRWNERTVILHLTHAYMHESAKNLEPRYVSPLSVCCWQIFSCEQASACIRADKIRCKDELGFSSICSLAISRRIMKAWVACRTSVSTVACRFYRPVYIEIFH